MSMTREEAITQLDLLLEYCESMMTSEYPVWRRDCEALQMLIAALRPISREQVEKVWRGEWNVIYDELNGFTYVTCSKCRDETVLNGCFVTVEGEPCDLEDFCPHCGAPMTDEAMQMVMERMEAVYEQDND